MTLAEMQQISNTLRLAKGKIDAILTKLAQQHLGGDQFAPTVDQFSEAEAELVRAREEFRTLHHPPVEL